MNSYWILIALQILNYQPGKVEVIPDTITYSQKECNAAKAKATKAYLAALRKATTGKGDEIQVNVWCVPVKFTDPTIEGPDECDGCR